MISFEDSRMRGAIQWASRWKAASTEREITYPTIRRVKKFMMADRDANAVWTAIYVMSAPILGSNLLRF